MRSAVRPPSSLTLTPDARVRRFSVCLFLSLLSLSLSPSREHDGGDTKSRDLTLRFSEANYLPMDTFRVVIKGTAIEEFRKSFATISDPDASFAAKAAAAHKLQGGAGSLCLKPLEREMKVRPPTPLLFSSSTATG